MGFESAELTKTAINIYLIGSVTYANALADLCEAVGADWSEMMPALRLDKRIGPAAYIRPSLGVAGGNLERDLVTLRQLGRRARCRDDRTWTRSRPPTTPASTGSTARSDRAAADSRRARDASRSGG